MWFLPCHAWQRACCESSLRLQPTYRTGNVHAQMKRAHKRAMEDRAYAQKSKGDVQVFPSPQSVLETTSFSGSDDHV